MPNTTYGSPYAQSSDLVSNWPGVSLNLADRLDDVSFKGNGLNDQTGTTYTLVLTDAGKTVTLNNASAVTVTVPTNASVAYEIGTCIYLTNKGAGVVTISAAGGVTLNNAVTLSQYATAYIQKLDTNTWVTAGAPATAGLNYVTIATFSAVSSVSVNNCFTSTYDNYRIIYTGIGSANDITQNMRLRVSGADSSALTYNAQALEAGSTTLTGSRSTSVAQWAVGGVDDDDDANVTVIEVFRPNLATRTSFISQCIYTVLGSRSIYMGGYFDNSTVFDGFTLYPASGTFSGTIRVYGYRNS